MEFPCEPHLPRATPDRRATGPQPRRLPPTPGSSADAFPHRWRVPRFSGHDSRRRPCPPHLRSSVTPLAGVPASPASLCASPRTPAPSRVPLSTRHPDARALAAGPSQPSDLLLPSVLPSFLAATSPSQHDDELEQGRQSSS
nr:serine/arginine-rich splicing factor SR45-like [Lolium perenne]